MSSSPDLEIRRFHKLDLAADMLIDADSRLRREATTLDYVTVILLAGAVANIIIPLLKEAGVKPAREIFANLTNMFEGRPADAEKVDPRDFLFAYNSLKHAGGGGRGKASEDLVVEMCLYSEAMSIMQDTILDASQLPVTDSDRARFRDCLQHLIESDLYSLD